MERNLKAREKDADSAKNFDKIIIPNRYYPTTRYGKIIITIKDGRIVNCETTTTHKIQPS